MYECPYRIIYNVLTSYDIGEKELDTMPDCVVRHVVNGGTFNIEPNGVGMFAIEKELDATFANGSVSFIELKHSIRFGVPNVSELFLRTQQEFEAAITQDKLCVVDGKDL